MNVFGNHVRDYIFLTFSSNDGHTKQEGINDIFQGLFWCFIPDSVLLSWPDCCAMFGVTHRLKKIICCFFFFFAWQSVFGNFTCRRSNRDSWGHHERPCWIFHLEWTVALSTAFYANDLTNIKRKKKVLKHALPV